MHPLDWHLGNLAAGKQVRQEFDSTQFTGCSECLVIATAFSLCQFDSLYNRSACHIICVLSALHLCVWLSDNGYL